MDDTSDVGEFLATRRAKITPREAGLATSGRRRVPGLRREEVAMLAGVSTDYYAKIERGNLAGVSHSVIDAVAGALRLDEAEHAHLRDLAAAANATPQARKAATPTQTVRPGVQRILDGMVGLPAFVRNARLDLLAINSLGAALYTPVFDDPHRPANLARFNFLDPRARDFYPDWDHAANTAVALLRTEAGRNPFDRHLTDLIGELVTRSDVFRHRWAAHNVRLHQTGTKHFQHPAVGTLDLAFEAMNLSADTGLTLTVYSAEPGSPSADGLSLLASWAATHTATEHAVPAAVREDSERNA
ncbi:helix-turn-helix domain-containing protein [Mycobacterium sp. ZZG]